MVCVGMWCGVWGVYGVGVVCDVCGVWSGVYVVCVVWCVMFVVFVSCVVLCLWCVGN